MLERQHIPAGNKHYNRLKVRPDSGCERDVYFGITGSRPAPYRSPIFAPYRDLTGCSVYHGSMGNMPRKMPGPVIEKRDKMHYVRWGKRVLGPFLREENDLILAGPDVRAVMGFIRRGREKPRRCVICIWIAAEGRRVFFSANGDETLEDAIEVVNAGGTNTGAGIWGIWGHLGTVLDFVTLVR